INKHICCSVIFPDMQNTDFFNQPSCSHLQIKRQLGWIQVARMKLLWLMRALRKSSGKVEIKMQHGRRLIESAARCWNLLMAT
uniref:Uncharacterized protein n=1 Tax=Aegilops tauschii subsp. strangulata TaxID=200361 RepID=A0A453IGF1_AEGTS